MKKILFVLTTILIVSSVVCSCSKDEDDGYSIVGTWKGSIYFRFTDDGNWFEYGASSEYEIGKYRDHGKYTFDGTYLALDGGFKKEVVFSEDGKKMKWNGILYYKIE